MARFTRSLPFAAELDEAVQLFRASWRPLVFLSALWHVPYYVVLLFQQIGPVARAITNPAVLNEQRTASADGWFWLVIPFGYVAYACAGASVTAATNDLVRGQHPAIGVANRVAVSKAAVVVHGVLLSLAGLGAVAVVSIPLLLFTVLGLGGVVPLIGLLLWACRPGLRSRRLKWLIILTTPFGLFNYCAIRWLLWTTVVVLESKRAIPALRRSSALVEGRWFRAFGVYSLTGIVVVLLGSGPWALATTVLGLAGIYWRLGRPTPLRVSHWHCRIGCSRHARGAAVTDRFDLAHAASPSISGRH